jgi:hypothetical protein
MLSFVLALMLKWDVLRYHTVRRPQLQITVRASLQVVKSSHSYPDPDLVGSSCPGEVLFIFLRVPLAPNIRTSLG